MSRRAGSPSGGCGAVAERGAGVAREDGGDCVRARRDPPVRHRVHTVVEAVQAADADAVVDRALRES